MTRVPAAPLQAEWVSRAVPVSSRVKRAVRRDRIDWAHPGQPLTQSFHTTGVVTGVSVDLAAPRDVDDPYTAPVDFSIRVLAESGHIVGESRYEGPQLIWERFSNFIAVDPPAPPGRYEIVLDSRLTTIGWYAMQTDDPEPDDGVSPVPLTTPAWKGVELAPGVRLSGIETAPAPNPVFRHRFHIDGEIHNATLRAVVLGCGDVFINGAPVLDGALDLPVVDYNRTVPVRTWDVRHLVVPGVNEIVIEAGRDRYAARGVDIWGWYLAPWHSEPCAIAELTIQRARGGDVLIATGADWQTSAGDVAEELLFGGETHVVRHHAPVWEPVTVVAGPRGDLIESDVPLIRPEEPIPPVSSITLSPHSIVHDFGAVMTGRMRLTVSGRAGASVRITSGELLTDAGGVLCDNPLVTSAPQVDVIRLERDVTSLVWSQRFGYRGFRWVQIDDDGDVEVSLVRAEPLHTSLQTMGQFRCDDPLINWVDSALARTFRNNMHSVPTDTPIYEKNGWTADAHLATEALLQHFDLRPGFGKWMDDHVDAQTADGSVPQIIPTPGWGLATDPAWSISAVLVPWYLYGEYGDLGILARYRDLMCRYADHVASRLDNGLWRHRTWGDWLSPGHTLAPEGMVGAGTLMSISAFRLVARIVALLDEDSSAYDELGDLSAAAFHARFFRPETGDYRTAGVGYRQAINVLALAGGVVPAAHIASVESSLIDDIETRTQGHLDCGALGARHLLPVLSRAGRDDLALTVLLQRSRPGWGAWFVDGDMTMRESWDLTARSSNHYFLGAAASWVQQRVGGIARAEAGWTTFLVDPIRDARVGHGHVAHTTPHGPAELTWSRGPGGQTLDLLVPQGSRAVVPVGGDEVAVGPGRHHLFRPAETASGGGLSRA